jgi:peptidoglycan/LPS O-acetylase OafA/YrhL
VVALDGIRAVAILAVIGTHLNWLPGGHLGVTVFFTLSGFLITTILVNEHDRTGRVDLRRFYVRRARRLMPALLAVLPVASLWVAVNEPHPLRTILIGVGSTIGYVSNFVTAAGGPTGDAYGWAWSLSIEEQFYLLWAPLFVLLATRHRWLAAIAAALSALAIVERFAWAHPHGVTPMALYVRTDARADAILIGCLAALAWRRGWLRWLRWGVPAAAVVLGWEFLRGATTFRSTYTVGMLAVELATVVLIAAALQGGITARLLALPPMAHIGRISYSLYLWDVLTRDIVAQWLHADPWHLPAVGVVASLALLTFAAEVSWFYVEGRARPARPAPQVPRHQGLVVTG